MHSACRLRRLELAPCPRSGCSVRPGAVVAELAQAIIQAQRLAWRLGVEEGDSGEARELYGRLETVRAEVDSLRFGDWIDVRREVHPSYLERLLDECPWVREQGRG